MNKSYQFVAPRSPECQNNQIPVSIPTPPHTPKYERRNYDTQCRDPHFRDWRRESKGKRPRTHKRIHEQARDQTLRQPLLAARVELALLQLGRRAVTLRDTKNRQIGSERRAIRNRTRGRPSPQIESRITPHRRPPYLPSSSWRRAPRPMRARGRRRIPSSRRRPCGRLPPLRRACVRARDGRGKKP